MPRTPKQTLQKPLPQSSKVPQSKVQSHSGPDLQNLQRSLGNQGLQRLISGDLIQRIPDKDDTKKEKRRDVVLLMASGLGAEAIVLAPDGLYLTVSSVDEMLTKLKAITFPIKNLVIISHSLPSGDLGFGGLEGTTYIRASVLASKLAGVIPADKTPEKVDFRGCSIGSSPAAMEQIRNALGAGSAIGGNCFNVTQVQGPVLLGDEAITKPKQVRAEDRPEFETGLQMLIDAFGPSKGCILDRSETSYFRTGGKMVAQWFSPDLSGEWDARKSRCYSEVTPETVDPSKTNEGDLAPGIAGHCRLIRVEKKKVFKASENQP